MRTASMRGSVQGGALGGRQASLLVFAQKDENLTNYRTK
jgi:hypothetical protein